MQTLAVVRNIVVVAVCLGCNADASTGPSVESDLITTARSTLASNAIDVLPRSARANAKVYCAGSNCFGAAFEFRNYPDGKGPHSVNGPYTVLTAYFQSLEGTYPIGGSTPLVLSVIYFDFFVDKKGNYGDAFNGTTGPIAVGNVQVGTGDHFFHDGPISPPPNWDSFYADVGSGVIGCNTNTGNPPLWFTLRTCPSQGLDGWAKFEFILVRQSEAGFFTRPPVNFDDFFMTFGTRFTTGSLCTIGGNPNLAPTIPAPCTELSYRVALGLNN